MKDFANSNEQSAWNYALRSYAFEKEMVVKIRPMINRLQSLPESFERDERIQRLEALVTRHIEQIQKWEDRYPQLKEKSNG